MKIKKIITLGVICLAINIVSLVLANVLATDTFVRADNADLGANWDAGYTGQNALQIVSNSAQASVLNTNSAETYNAVVMPDDQAVLVTLKTITGAVPVYLCVELRATAPATYTNMHFCAAKNDGSFKTLISKIVAGVETGLVSDNVTQFVDGDQLYVTSIGNLHTLYRVVGGVGSPVQILQVSNSDIPTGSRAGLAAFVATGGSLADGAFGPISFQSTVTSSCGNLILMGVGC